MLPIKLKPVAVAVAMAASALVSVNASADVVVPVTSNPFVYVSPIQGTAFFDAFTFTLPSTYDLNVTVTSLESTLGDLSVLSIADGTVQLWSISGTPTPISSPVSFGSNITFSGITAGEYGISVSGTPTGFAGGLYSFAVSAAPVPEPGTWAMLATGGVLLGLALRRGSNNKA